VSATCAFSTSSWVPGRAKPCAGETEGFLRLLDVFLLALNGFNIFLEIGTAV